MFRFLKKKSCPLARHGGSASELLALTLSDGIRTWTEYVLPVKLVSGALVDVETVAGIRKIGMTVVFMTKILLYLLIRMVKSI